MVGFDLDLIVEYRSPGDIVPFRTNPRLHPKKQVAQIAASIRAHGFINPILIDELREIIGGHGRLLAAKLLGLSSVPTITLTGLSSQQKRALRIADNKIALNSEWDPDNLRFEIQEILIADPTCEVESLGFSTGEVDVLLAEEPGEPEEPPTPAETAVSQAGDIWVAEGHRIGCGDCRDQAFLQRVFASSLADAAFLDPPYNCRINGHAVRTGSHREFAIASGELSASQFTDFLANTLGSAAAFSRPAAVHFVCIDHHHLDEALTATNAIYGERLNICVWNKNNPGMGSLYRSKHELILVLRVGNGAHFNAVELGKHGRNRSNVWDYASVNTPSGARRHDLKLHPTVKPIQLVADAIQDVTKRGQVIADLFLGSGTTLLAAERTGRRCIGVELDPLYVDMALRRWTQTTGATVRLEDGRTFEEVASQRSANIFGCMP